jgi:excisionase family DNA binding protein
MNALIDFDLLTLSEVAELLHCSKAHVGKVVSGRVPGCPPIPAVSLGRRKLVRRASLLAWIEDNEHAAANDNLTAVANDNLRASPERGRKSA